MLGFGDRIVPVGEMIPEVYPAIGIGDGTGSRYILGSHAINVAGTFRYLNQAEVTAGRYFGPGNSLLIFTDITADKPTGHDYLVCPLSV